MSRNTRSTIVIYTARLFILFNVFLPLFAQEGEHQPDPAKGETAAKAAKKDDTGYFNVDWKARRQVYFHKLTGFQAFYETVPGTISDHARNFPDSWGRGPGGFVKRFGSQYGQFAADETIEFAMSGWRQEDPRYHRKETGGIGSRLAYSLGALFWTYNEKGKKTVASARLTGIYGGWAIATVGWLPESEKSFNRVMFNAGLNVITKAGANTFREFWPDAKKKFFSKKHPKPPVSVGGPEGSKPTT